jgi:hypothetical protein
MVSNGPSWGRRDVLRRQAFDYWREKQREADAAAVRYWNIRMEERGPARPSPTLGAAVNGGYRFLRVRCTGCKQVAFVALEAVQRPAHTPLWVLEDALGCRRCGELAPFPPRARLERVTRDDRDVGWASP